jgi:hypothetical protein
MKKVYNRNESLFIINVCNKRFKRYKGDKIMSRMPIFRKGRISHFGICIGRIRYAKGF